MQPTSTEERQARAGRNQSLFRALNEKLSDINDTLSTVTETFVISCECADTSCVEMLDIRPDEYRGPRRPALVRRPPEPCLPGGGERDQAMDGYVVVEKFGAGAAVASEAIDSTPMTDGPDIPRVDRASWLQHLIRTAESAAADLRDRDDPTEAVLIADLDAP